LELTFGPLKIAGDAKRDLFRHFHLPIVDALNLGFEIETEKDQRQYDKGHKSEHEKQDNHVSPYSPFHGLPQF
jgi:hypothetical protein